MQLRLDGGLTSSFVQIRGSVPAHWEQKGLSAELNFTQALSLSKEALKKHYRSIMKEYGNTVVVNLLNEDKPNEKNLTEVFEQLTSRFQARERLTDKFLKYIYFNFSKLCPGKNFNKIDELLNEWRRVITLFGYFQVGKGRKAQSGVIRTCCLDCVDRTNIFQFFVAKHSLKKQLIDLGFKINESVESALAKLFEINGEIISLQYSGGAGVFAKFFKNWLDDDFRQSAIDTLLCKDPHAMPGIFCI